jgi:hypothetical protein
MDRMEDKSIPVEIINNPTDSRLKPDFSFFKMYDNLGFIDNHGSTLFAMIFILLLLVLFISFCIIQQYIQPIRDNWQEYKCHPFVIPFAGYIQNKDRQYTVDNFNECTQNILVSQSGEAISPLTFIVENMLTILNGFGDALNAMRKKFSQLRNTLQNVGEELMSRVLNIMMPIMQMVISFRDMMNKVQGIMTAGLYTLFGTYMTLKSLMGSIAQIIATILIAMAAMIAALWATPFTWGAAAANTAVFLSLSIPLALMLAFMSKTMGVNAKIKIPKVKLKCFDKHTKMTMYDRSLKSIYKLRAGDHLLFLNKKHECIPDRVIALIQLETEGSTMYKLKNGPIVSDTHLVQDRDRWIRVLNLLNKKWVDEYSEPYIYCLITEQKQLQIGKYVFSDWDETDVPLLHHVFEISTKIKMNDGSEKEIKDVQIGDILWHNNRVYGIAYYEHNAISLVTEKNNVYINDQKIKTKY